MASKIFFTESTAFIEITFLAIICSARMFLLHFGTSFFRIGCYLALHALSYRPLVNNDPIALEMEIVRQIGMKMLIA